VAIWYKCTMVTTEKQRQQYVVERVQTGVRMEKRILKVLKALAEYHDLTLGDLLEGIVLHAFEGKCAFEKTSLGHIAEFKRIYGLDLDASASHRLIESRGVRPLAKKEKK
jgi:predicted DNA-binding ribbon-helix-helix protein